MNERITIEPGKRSGQPCVRGMRITVADVLEYLASGMFREQLIEDFLQRSVLLGHPPKIVHLTIGNCAVSDIVELLLNNASQLKAFDKHTSKSYLLLP